jgi:IS30 family transposase
MRQWTDKEKQQIAKLLRQGKHAREIGALFGRSKSAVISVILRNPELKAIGLPRQWRRAA